MICILLLLLFTFAVCWMIVRCADKYDHEIELAMAVEDYLEDADNFDLRRYPDITEEDIRREVEKRIQGK